MRVVTAYFSKLKPQQNNSDDNNDNENTNNNNNNNNSEETTENYFTKEELRASSDPLSFLVHDLCHLEKFVDPNHYLEQIGFHSQCDFLPAFFWEYVNSDETFKEDIDYMMADMNGSSVFAVSYFKHKFMEACARRKYKGEIGETEKSEKSAKSYQAIFKDQKDRDEFYVLYQQILSCWGLEGDLREATMKICTEMFDHELHSPLIRTYFREKGIAKMVRERKALEN
eukprot:TRINITY_DN16037_c0_g1_i1.p1 TRINITY_DN16037_c0_g1~~TRINITY_DN16037_c0_g1_i1.p1  ORF type:complete len:227 (+),score=61.15 TRINITY_DN16037_c0_g1_i1:1-681(+)